MKNSTVSALRSLLKKLQHQLDTAVQRRTHHEVRKVMLEHDKEQLLTHLKSERENLDKMSKNNDPSGGCDIDILHAYTQRILEKQEYLDECIQECDQHIQDEHATMLTLFKQKKTYDTLIEHHEIEEKNRMDKHERETLDEVGARRFTYPQKSQD